LFYCCAHCGGLLERLSELLLTTPRHAIGGVGLVASRVQLRCASGQVGSKDGLTGCPLVCTINGLKESNVEVALEDSNYK